MFHFFSNKQSYLLCVTRVVKGIFLWMISTYAVAMGPFHPYASVDVGVMNTNAKSVGTLAWADSIGTVTNRYNSTGALGDINLGVIKPFNRFFLGANAGYNYMNQTSRIGTNASYLGDTYYDNTYVNLKYFYSFMGQVGYSINDSSSIFFTMGGAYGQFNFGQSVKFTYLKHGISGSRSPMIWGTDVGIGLKQNITPKLALVLTGQYIDFQTYSESNVHALLSKTGLNDKISISPNVLIAKLGVEYYFDDIKATFDK